MPAARKPASQDVVCGIYVRISKDKTGEGLGVQRQEEDCEALRQQMGWKLHRLYRDNDVSASNAKKGRPDFEAMLEDLRDGVINGIIAWHPDRLYRMNVDLDRISAVFRDRSEIQVATVRAGVVDLSTPTGRAMAAFSGTMARLEVEQKSDRWTRSRQQMREQGKPPKSRARLFGYDATGLNVVPDEAVIIRRLAREVLAVRPISALCRELNQEGVVTTLGNPWRPNTLRNLLANPRLAGLTQWRGEIVGTGTWQPILERTTWDSVNVLLKSRSVRKNGRVSLLNGLLYCSLCGHKLHTGSRDKGVRTYRCPIAPPYQGCGRMTIDALRVEDVVESFAREVFRTTAVVDAAAKRISGTDADVTSMVAKLDELAMRSAELANQLTTPGIPVTVILKAIADVDAEAEAIRTTIARKSSVKTFTAANWPTDLGERQAAVAMVVQKVIIKPSVGGRFRPERVEIQGFQAD